jgi:hypothetical protein
VSSSLHDLIEVVEGSLLGGDGALVGKVPEPCEREKGHEDRGCIRFIQSGETRIY